MTAARWGILVTLVQGNWGTVVGLFAEKVATPHSVRTKACINRITHPQEQTDIVVVTQAMGVQTQSLSETNRRATNRP